MVYKVQIFSIILFIISNVQSNYKLDFLSETLDYDIKSYSNDINNTDNNEYETNNSLEYKYEKNNLNDDDQGTKIRCMWFNTKSQIIYDLKLLQRQE